MAAKNSDNSTIRFYARAQSCFATQAICSWGFVRLSCIPVGWWATRTLPELPGWGRLGRNREIGTETINKWPGDCVKFISISGDIGVFGEESYQLRSTFG
jgi:hypothetical protein